MSSVHLLTPRSPGSSSQCVVGSSLAAHTLAPLRARTHQGRRAEASAGRWSWLPSPPRALHQAGQFTPRILSSEVICKLGQNHLFHKTVITIQFSLLAERSANPEGNIFCTSLAEISYLQHVVPTPYASQNLQDLLYFDDRQKSATSN